MRWWPLLSAKRPGQSRRPRRSVRFRRLLGVADGLDVLHDRELDVVGRVARDEQLTLPTQRVEAGDGFTNQVRLAVHTMEDILRHILCIRGGAQGSLGQTDDHGRKAPPRLDGGPVLPGAQRPCHIAVGGRAAVLAADQG
jgi:hypothetical protein